MKNKNAFTLLEMMIVLLIITVILLITLPNIQQKEKIIRAKGCESLLSIIDSQILLYEIENDSIPTISQLIADGYFKRRTSSMSKWKPCGDRQWASRQSIMPLPY